MPPFWQGLGFWVQGWPRKGEISMALRMFCSFSTGTPLMEIWQIQAKGSARVSLHCPTSLRGQWGGDRGQYPLEMDGNPAPSPTFSCDTHPPPLLPPTAATFQLGMPPTRTHGPTLPILQQCQCGWHISQADTCPRLPGRTLPSALPHRNWWRWRLLELAC